MVEIKKILHDKIYYYEQLDSTNLKALELAKQGGSRRYNCYCRKADCRTRTNAAEMGITGGEGIVVFHDPQTNDSCRILRPNNAADSRCCGESFAGAN